MRRTLIFISLTLLWTGCNKNNPVSPTTDVVNSDNLQVTFSIPQHSYGINDTMMATTRVYNPGDTTVIVYVPVCWPIAWYKVYDSRGAIRLSYNAPRDYGCYSIGEFLIQPHESLSIPLLSVVIRIASLDSTQSPEGSYVLRVDDGLGTFSVGFAVN